jgi:hypothetical protein
MPMSINPNLVSYNSYLQDNNANILFDADGYVLEGTSYFDKLNKDTSKTNNSNNVISYEFDGNCEQTALRYGISETNWRHNPVTNANGYFNISKSGFNFSSDNISRVIMLEYISDGLENSKDEEISINKLAVSCLNNYVMWNLLSNIDTMQEYKIKRAKDEYFATLRNTKIKLMNTRANDVMHLMNNRRQWLK